MLRDAVIDEDIRGWFMTDNKGHLDGYGKTFTAGKNGDLPWLDSDDKIATFCSENDCDLFTSDKKSYTSYLMRTYKLFKLQSMHFGEMEKGPFSR